VYRKIKSYTTVIADLEDYSSTKDALKYNGFVDPRIVQISDYQHFLQKIARTNIEEKEK
jgi:hypothetical protein